MREVRIETNEEQIVDCVFCRIVAGEIPTKILAENDVAIAFPDIHPQSPVHVLVVPKVHDRNILEFSANHPELVAGFFELISTVATEQTSGSFRLQFNTGAAAGQTVFHTHAHILA